MKRLLTYIILAAMLLFTTACSDKGKTEDNITPSPTSPVATASPTASPTATPTPTTIEFVSLDNVDHVTIPESSDRLSYTLAKQLLALCSGHTAEKTKESFEQAGFQVLYQANFDKASDSREHTSAYTIGLKVMQVGEQLRPVVLLAVRGTNAGEWFSNFDVAPSRDINTLYAENFLYTAQNALLGLQEVMKLVNAQNVTGQAPLLLICGHSRGAATANLLGYLLDEIYPEENVYVYTYATPATVRAGFNVDESGQEKKYTNIFNFINPCDLVPEAPLEKWGYKRVGRDITLPENREIRVQLIRTVATLEKLAPNLNSYYNDLHRVGKGFIKMDITTYQLMQMVANVFAFGSQMNQGNPDNNPIIPDTSGIQNSLNLGGIFDGTDFEELFKLFDEAEGGISSGTVLEGHMPARYLELLEEMEKEQ